MDGFTKVNGYVDVGGVAPEIFPDSVGVAVRVGGLFGWVVGVFAWEDSVQVCEKAIFGAGKD